MAFWSKTSKTEQPSRSNISPTAQLAPITQVVPPHEQQLSALAKEDFESASARASFTLGQVVSLLMRTPPYRARPLAAIESLVVPPVLLGQVLLARALSNPGTFIGPIAVVLWAKVSADVDKRLCENLDQPPQLAPNEWSSGDIPWLVLAAGEAGAITPMIEKLQRTYNHPLKMRVRNKEGKMVVTTIADRNGVRRADGLTS